MNIIIGQVQRIVAVVVATLVKITAVVVVDILNQRLHHKNKPRQWLSRCIKKYWVVLQMQADKPHLLKLSCLVLMLPHLHKVWPTVKKHKTVVSHNKLKQLPTTLPLIPPHMFNKLSLNNTTMILFKTCIMVFLVAPLMPLAYKTI